MFILMRLIPGIAFVYLGVAFVFFNRRLTEWHFRIQNRIFGTKYEWPVKSIPRLFSYVGGAFFIFVGLMIILSAMCDLFYGRQR
jgi:hypothetical protein